MVLSIEGSGTMKDCVERNKHDNSPVDQATPKACGTKQLTIADWLHEDLLFKAGLPGELEQSKMTYTSNVPSSLSVR